MQPANLEYQQEALGREHFLRAYVKGITLRAVNPATGKANPIATTNLLQPRPILRWVVVSIDASVYEVLSTTAYHHNDHQAIDQDFSEASLYSSTTSEAEHDSQEAIIRSKGPKLNCCLWSLRVRNSSSTATWRLPTTPGI